MIRVMITISIVQTDNNQITNVITIIIVIVTTLIITATDITIIIIPTMLAVTVGTPSHKGKYTALFWG